MSDSVERAANKARHNKWTEVVETYLAWLLILAGVATVGAFLTALAGGFGGWIIVSATLAAFLFLSGWLAAHDGTRRRAAEPHVIVYHPDWPDVAVDVDQDTGLHSIHRIQEKGASNPAVEVA